VRDDQNNEDKKMKKYETALPCDLTADSAYNLQMQKLENKSIKKLSWRGKKIFAGNK